MLYSSAVVSAETEFELYSVAHGNGDAVDYEQSLLKQKYDALNDA